MGKKTTGQLEEEISQAIIRFEKEYLGRGPLEARTYLVYDLVIIRLKNVLTPAELTLTGSSESGRNMIKQSRQQLFETGAAALSATIAGILDTEVSSMHTDISTRTGERIIVFTLTRKPRPKSIETT